MNTVYVVHAITDACDHYTWVYKNRPNKDDIYDLVWQTEGKCKRLQFYHETVKVEIQLREVR